jgi:alkyl hydroperoxide reductase subunit AhpF
VRGSVVATDSLGGISMAKFDYDVLIVGAGFDGSVAALRAAEKG